MSIPELQNFIVLKLYRGVIFTPDDYTFLSHSEKTAAKGVLFKAAYSLFQTIHKIKAKGHRYLIEEVDLISNANVDDSIMVCTRITCSKGIHSTLR